MNELYDDLRRRLRQYKEKPEPRLWNSISARIEEANRPARLNKKIRNGWIFLIAISIVCGGLFLKVDDSTLKNISTRPLIAKQESTDQVHPESNGRSSMPSTATGKNYVDSNANVKSSDVRQNDGADIGVSKQMIGDNAAADVYELHEESIELKGSVVALDQFSHEANNVYDSSKIFTETHVVIRNEPPKLATNEPEKNGSLRPDEQEEKGRTRRFKLYFTIMPTLGYQRIKPNENDNLIITSTDRIKTFDTDRLGVRGELGAEYPISSRVNVFGGLLYFQRQQTIGYTEKQVSQTEITTGPNGETVVEPEFSYVHKSFDYEVKNLGLQLGINYQLAKKTFLHTAGTGMEFHIALNKLQEKKVTSDLTTNPSVYVFYNLYYRVQYPADTKLKGVFQPTLNYAFYINENAHAPFYVKPYGLGLNIGFTYTF
jgi:hypothetical protein